MADESFVTQAGANTAQQSDESRVTQAGAYSAQQSSEVRVTQIGLLVIYADHPLPPICPGLTEGIRQDGLAAGPPMSNCDGGSGTLGAPRIGASYESTMVAGGRRPYRYAFRRAA